MSRLGLLGTLAMPIGIAAGGFGLWVVLSELGYTRSPTHVVSSGRAISRAVPRSCAEARAMGYGTAQRGQPGYFAHLDADNDGWSCEPLPGNGQRR